MTATDEFLTALYPDGDWGRWPILCQPDEQVSSIDYVVAQVSTRAVTHWHLVTQGLEARGFDMELTLRIPYEREDEEPPDWGFRLLVSLARYINKRGPVSPGDTQDLDFMVSKSLILPATCYLEDVELGSVETPAGNVSFVQIFGLARDEYDLLRLWSAREFIEEIRSQNPAMVTDPRRRSSLMKPEFRARLEARAQSGTSDRRIVIGDVLLGLRGELFEECVSLRTAETIIAELLPRARFGGGGGIAFPPAGGILAFEHADVTRWNSIQRAALWCG